MNKNLVPPKFSAESVDYANKFFSRLNSDVLPNDAALTSINSDDDTLTFLNGEVGITVEATDDNWYQTRVWYTKHSIGDRWSPPDAWDVDLTVIRGRSTVYALAELAAFLVKEYLLAADADEEEALAHEAATNSD